MSRTFPHTIMDILMQGKASAEQGCFVTPPANNRQALAFGLVLAAGLSTSIGAIIAIALPYLRVPKNLLLASFLSIAAGVMIYVSFVEIFAVKAIFEFERCYKKTYVLRATLCFFAGIAITAVFDKILHVVQNRFFSKSQDSTKQNESKRQSDSNQTQQEGEVEVAVADGDVTSELANGRKGFTAAFRNVLLNGQRSGEGNDDVESQGGAQGAGSNNKSSDNMLGSGDGDGDGHMIAGMYDRHMERAKLIRMGLFAGIALAFHNFPEGLATYVSVMNDPSVGFTVALAIAVHNIPEGICVAMPIYYATKSRGWALFWAFLSGMTELVGALLGYFFLADIVTPEVYGVLFALVAGMMVYISIKELLPTAHVYDPKNKVTSISFITGMAIMAISIVLFSF